MRRSLLNRPLALTLTLAYTVSRAILADAIALTRGDRFFTSEYTL